MSSNVLYYYKDPVVYRKALEEASHGFDEQSELLQEIATSFSEELNMLECTLNGMDELSADELSSLKEDLSLREDSSTEEIAETLETFVKELRPKIEQLQKGITIIKDVELPLSGVISLLLERMALEQMDEETTGTLLSLTREDVADIIFNSTNLTGSILVRYIRTPDFDRLLDSYNRGDQKEFIEILEKNKDTCDFSAIIRYANTEAALQLGGWRDILHGAANKEDESIERISYIAGDNSAESLQELFSRTRNLENLEDFSSIIDIYFEMCGTYERCLNGFCTLFFEGKVGLKKPEQVVIKSILSRPAGIDLYNRYMAEFEMEERKSSEKAAVDEMDANMKALRSPEDRNVLNQISENKDEQNNGNSPSCPVIPDGLSREEMEEQLSRKYSFEILSKRDRVSPTIKNKWSDITHVYYEKTRNALNGGKSGRLNPDFCENLSKVFWALVDIYAIEMTDRNFSLLLYRFGGINYGRYDEDPYIHWMLDKNDLSCFLKYNVCDGSKYTWAKEFFKIGNDDYLPDKQASIYASNSPIRENVENLGKQCGTYIPKKNDIE